MRRTAVAKNIVRRVRRGSLVKMRPQAIAQGLLGRAHSPKAVVFRVRPPFQIQVRRDGLQGLDWYWAGFWTVVRR